MVDFCLNMRSFRQMNNWDTVNEFGSSVPRSSMISRSLSNTNSSPSVLSLENLELARRSRGTPRLANRLLKRVRDFAQVKYDGVITKEVANYALDLLDVDKFGLDHIDRNILITMIEKFQGGPVGLETLAASISEDAGTLEDVYEPYLLKNGFIQRTPRGRVVTELAYQHLGIPREV